MRIHGSMYIHSTIHSTAANDENNLAHGAHNSIQRFLLFRTTRFFVVTVSQWRVIGRLSPGKSSLLVNIIRGYFHPLQNTPRGYFHPLQNTPYKKTTAYNRRLFRQ